MCESRAEGSVHQGGFEACRRFRRFERREEKEGKNLIVATPKLSKLKPFGPKEDYVNAIIEAPKGSRIKFKYEEKLGLFRFHKLLPSGLFFPFEFGFIPSTKGGDGDPLDVLVLSEEPTFVGCLIHVKLLGVIEAKQTEKGTTERNDRLIAAPLEESSGKLASPTTQLSTTLTRKIVKFFQSYNELQGKRFHFLRSGGPARAIAVVKGGILGSRRR
jgi:inorganic pyrophosphatase